MNGFTNLFLILLSLSIPNFLFAQIIITEIMYDLEGSDAGREWIEITNIGSESVDLEGWKFYDGSNHLLNVPPKNGSTGTLVLGPNEVIILADKADQFLLENTVSVSVIDTVMSLGQKDGQTYVLKLFDSNGIEVSSATYTTAILIEEGQSLSWVNGAWVGSTPNPGVYASGSVSGNGNSSSGSNTNASNDDGGSVPPIQSPKEKISTKIVSEKTFLSGADSLFKADSLGTKNEKLENARHLWNFGDGTLAEGQQILHNFIYPGEYIVYLDVTSGKYSANDKVYVSVIPSSLSITEGSQDFIKLYNDSSQELNISFWMLAVGKESFTIPENTYIKTKGSITFPYNVTNLNGSERPLRLLYPNGKTAYEFSHLAVKPLSKSLSESPVESSFVDNTGSKNNEVSSPVSSEKEEENEQVASVVLGVIENSGDKEAIKSFGGKNKDFLNKWFLAVSGIVTLSILAVFLLKQENIIEGYRIID